MINLISDCGNCLSSREKKEIILAEFKMKKTYALNQQLIRSKKQGHYSKEQNKTKIKSNKDNLFFQYMILQVFVYTNNNKMTKYLQQKSFVWSR